MDALPKEVSAAMENYLKLVGSFFGQPLTTELRVCLERATEDYATLLREFGVLAPDDGLGLSFAGGDIIVYRLSEVIVRGLSEADGGKRC